MTSQFHRDKMHLSYYVNLSAEKATPTTIIKIIKNNIKATGLEGTVKHNIRTTYLIKTSHISCNVTKFVVYFQEQYGITVTMSAVTTQ